MRALPCWMLPFALAFSCTPGGETADTEPATTGTGGSSGSAWVLQPVWDAMYTSE